MTDTLDPEIQEIILRFVRERIEYIRSGNRERLDQTYYDLDLNRRNKYNRHDYEWYLNLIENGFGEDTRRIDIQPCQQSTPLPFSQYVTYPSAPDYKVFIYTVTNRRTLWLIKLYKDGPKVILPCFGGNTADSVATGEWQLPMPADEIEGATTVQEFHPEQFVEDLVESLLLILPRWTYLLKFEKIRALVLDCFPWFGQCHVAFLTSQEDYPEDEYGKWAIGDWRWNEADHISFELQQLLRNYYEGKTITDAELTLQQRADVIYQCIANALQSPKILALIQQFDLADDFEIAVFDPDHPDRGNFCDLNNQF